MLRKSLSGKLNYNLRSILRLILNKNKTLDLKKNLNFRLLSIDCKSKSFKMLKSKQLRGWMPIRLCKILELSMINSKMSTANTRSISLRNTRRIRTLSRFKNIKIFKRTTCRNWRLRFRRMSISGKKMTNWDSRCLIWLLKSNHWKTRSVSWIFSSLEVRISLLRPIVWEILCLSSPSRSNHSMSKRLS